MRTMVSAVNQSLYEEFGLKGNQADYYNPESRAMDGGKKLRSWPWKMLVICILPYIYPHLKNKIVPPFGEKFQKGFNMYSNCVGLDVEPC